MRDVNPLIRRLERDAVIWCGLATAAALALRRDAPGIAAGVVGGGLLALFSLLAIRSTVDALLARIQTDAPARAGLGLGVKLVGRYLVLGLAAYVMIARLRLHAVGVLIGASSLVAAASIEAVRTLRRP